MNPKPLLIITLLLFLIGCAAGADRPTDTKTWLETLEFEENEYGSIKVTGDVTLGTGIPFISTKVHLDYEKVKDAPNISE